MQIGRKQILSMFFGNLIMPYFYRARWNPLCPLPNFVLFFPKFHFFSVLIYCNSVFYTNFTIRERVQQCLHSRNVLPRQKHSSFLQKQKSTIGQFHDIPCLAMYSVFLGQFWDSICHDRGNLRALLSIFFVEADVG